MAAPSVCECGKVGKCSSKDCKCKDCPVVKNDDRPLGGGEIGTGEEAYVARLFDSFDAKHAGQLAKQELGKLCEALGSKPWTVFNELGVYKSTAVTKEAFLKWWFSTPKPVFPSSSPAKEKREAKKNAAEKEAARKVISVEIKKLKAALLEIEQALESLDD